MCVSNPKTNIVSKEVIKEQVKESGSRMLEGWKVLRRVNTLSRGYVLLSQLANEEWVPGIHKAQPAGLTGFKGGPLPDNQYGIHILSQKPVRLSKGDVALRVFCDSDKIVVIGDDTAGGVRCLTWVTHSCEVKQEDYDRAIKGDKPPATKAVKKAVKKTAESLVIPSEDAKEVIANNSGVSLLSKTDFVLWAKVMYNVSRASARELYDRVKNKADASRKCNSAFERLSDAVEKKALQTIAQAGYSADRTTKREWAKYVKANGLREAVFQFTYENKDATEVEAIKFLQSL